jgi:alpha-L-rhamnosidase
MLLREQMPSWLYPITKGATTIWERWDGIKPDGDINGGGLANNSEGAGDGMISFNHYAYGAVVDWIYRNLGGITPTAPGYSEVVIAPRPHANLTSSKTSLQTGYGEIALEWEIRDGNLVGELDIPFGVTATFDLLGSANTALIVNAAAAEKGQIFGHGRHSFLLNNPLIAR